MSVVLSRKFLEFLKSEKATVQIQKNNWTKSSWQIEQEVTDKLINTLIEENQEILYLRVKFKIEENEKHV